MRLAAAPTRARNCRRRPKPVTAARASLNAGSALGASTRASTRAGAGTGTCEAADGASAAAAGAGGATTGAALAHRGIDWRGRRHGGGKRGRTYGRQGNRLAGTEKRGRQGRQRHDGGLLRRDGFLGLRGVFGLRRFFWLRRLGRLRCFRKGRFGRGFDGGGAGTQIELRVAGGAIGQRQRNVRIGIGMQANAQEGGVLGGRIGGGGFRGGDLRGGGWRYGGDGRRNRRRQELRTLAFQNRRLRARSLRKRLPDAKPPRKTGRPPRRAKRHRPQKGSENVSSSDISRQTPPASSPGPTSCPKRQAALKQHPVQRSENFTRANHNKSFVRNAAERSHDARNLPLPHINFNRPGQA